MRRVDQRAAGRDVDEHGSMSWTHLRRLNGMIREAVMAACPAPVGHAVYNGFHCLVRESNLNTRTLPVCPYIRTTYCAFLPRMYKLPDEEVPAAAKVARFPDPSLTGSVPGGVPPGSTDGRPGSAPKSTPPNWSDNRSDATS